MPPPSTLNGTSAERTRLALIGLDRLTRSLAPWSDPAFDVWGINGAQQAPDLHRDAAGAFRADAWFQIHPLDFLSESESDWFRWAARLQVPTYVRPKDLERLPPDARNALLLPYPIEEVRATFPHGIFASSFCLQFALALLRGYEHIALFGVESRGMGREIAVERSAIAYWLGVAHARGVEVQLPASSTWGIYPYIYGFDYLEEAQWAAVATEQVIPSRWLRSAENDNLNTVASVAAAAEQTEG